MNFFAWYCVTLVDSKALASPLDILDLTAIVGSASLLSFVISGVCSACGPLTQLWCTVMPPTTADQQLLSCLHSSTNFFSFSSKNLDSFALDFESSKKRNARTLLYRAVFAMMVMHLT